MTRTGTWTATTDIQETYRILRLHRFAKDCTKDALRFLYGHCAVFALALHALRGYPVMMLADRAYDPGDPFASLCHMYCEVPAGPGLILADVRGVTDDETAFAAPFTEPGLRPPVRRPAPSPADIRLHLTGRMGERNYDAWYAEALLFIAGHRNWWPDAGTRTGKAAAQTRPLPHIAVRPNETKG